MTSSKALNRLAELEPDFSPWKADVDALARELKAEHRRQKPRWYCQHEVWIHGYGSYPSFKRRLARMHLGGYPSSWPFSTDLYRTALDYLLDTIPPCQRCGCAIS